MRPLILITNDDGITSPGLLAVVEAVEAIGELLIVAPIYQQTGMSRSHPKGEGIGVIEKFSLYVNAAQHLGYGVHGSPAQAVSHAVLELASRKPNLCISGINAGENMGLNITASGTVGAAFEANLYDIPAISVSQEVDLDLEHKTRYDCSDWNAAIHFTKYLADRVLREGIHPKIAVLNVNIPSSATIKTPMRTTTQSRQNYFTFIKPSVRDFSTGYEFKDEIRINKDGLEKSSDIQAVICDRVISVTPLTWDLSLQNIWGS